MPSLDADDVGSEGGADQGEVTEEVEDLVADELGTEAQVVVEHLFLADHHGAGQRSAPDQPGPMQGLHLVEEAEGACRRNLLGVAAVLGGEIEKYEKQFGEIEPKSENVAPRTDSNGRKLVTKNSNKKVKGKVKKKRATKKV